jgi:hypothetical protein
MVAAPTLLTMLVRSEIARGNPLSPDLEAMLGGTECNIQAGAGKVPFICFDLAGGANLQGPRSCWVPTASRPTSSRLRATPRWACPAT